MASACGLPVGPGAFAALGGAVSLLGWFTGTYRLTDWSGAGISVKANAALAALTAGLGLALLSARPRARRAIGLAGCLVALVAGLTLLEHTSGRAWASTA